MKTVTTIGSVVVVALVALAVGGCSIFESRFAKSAYGQELESMMRACGQMQKDGLLPGLAGGVNENLGFSSTEVDYAERDNVRYPLRLDCIVYDGREYVFTLVRESAGAKWKLVP